MHTRYPPPNLSLDQLWAKVEPTLDEIMQRDPAKLGSMPMPASKLMGAYTLVFNYCNRQGHACNSGLYTRCDAYFSNICRQLLLDSAQPQVEDPIRQTLDSFHRYTANVKTIDRQILSSLNRTFASTFPLSMKNHALGIKARKVQDLNQLGLVEGSSNELWDEIKPYAEAATTVDCVVPVASAAHRRFRLDFVEPQIQPGKSSFEEGITLDLPLAKAIERLLSLGEKEGSESYRLAQELANMFMTIGIRPSHPLYTAISNFLV